VRKEIELFAIIVQVHGAGIFDIQKRCSGNEDAMQDTDTVNMNRRLEALAAYASVDLSADEHVDTHGARLSKSNKSVVLPINHLSENAMDFIRTCYEYGWILSGFDWPGWASSLEAMELRDKKDSLSRATPEQLAKLLTVIIRQNRFIEGAFAKAVSSGIVSRIIGRAQTLLDEHGTR